MASFDTIPELTSPAAGDKLLVNDVSDASNPAKYLLLSRVGIPALAQTWSGIQTFSANALFSAGLKSLLETVAWNDDTAIAVPVAGCTRGFVVFTSGAGNGEHGCAFYRAESTPHCVGIGLGAVVEVATGALTGTTGTDNRITISAHSDGNLYFENRRGAGRQLRVILLG